MVYLSLLAKKITVLNVESPWELKLTWIKDCIRLSAPFWSYQNNLTPEHFKNGWIRIFAWLKRNNFNKISSLDGACVSVLKVYSKYLHSNYPAAKKENAWSQVTLKQLNAFNCRALVLNFAQGKSLTRLDDHSWIFFAQLCALFNMRPLITFVPVIQNIYLQNLSKELSSWLPRTLNVYPASGSAEGFHSGSPDCKTSALKEKKRKTGALSHSMTDLLSMLFL